MQRGYEKSKSIQAIEIKIKFNHDDGKARIRANYVANGSGDSSCAINRSNCPLSQ